MELMEKGSLRTVLRETPDIPWPRKLLWARELASGMAYIHQLGHVHRDLKSDNVLVSRSNHVKVTDFGTSTFYRRSLELGLAHGEGGSGAALLKEQPEDPVFHTKGIGTLLWMAPEVLAGKPYSPSVDVFSYAIVLWEIGAQTTPWPELKDVHAFLAQRLLELLLAERRPRVQPAWPQEYRKVMQACWNTEPTQRPTFARVLKMMKNWSVAKYTLDSETAFTLVGDDDEPFVNVLRGPETTSSVPSSRATKHVSGAYSSHTKGWRPEHRSGGMNA